LSHQTWRQRCCSKVATSCRCVITSYAVCWHTAGRACTQLPGLCELLYSKAVRVKGRYSNSEGGCTGYLEKVCCSVFCHRVKSCTCTHVSVIAVCKLLSCHCMPCNAQCACLPRPPVLVDCLLAQLSCAVRAVVCSP
jgi:hypothetical protein